MNIVFRTDASSIAGTGHVMRCLTLAKALRERGAAVSFVCREHSGHLCALILEMGFVVHWLAGCDGLAATRGEDSLDHAGWLGATQARDAAQTLAAVQATGVKPDWLIVDHYGIDEYWEKSLRPAVGRIMVIDDLADRQHDCDVLLDQNLVAEMEVRYRARVPAACRQLLGPYYALLQPDYAERHELAIPRKGAVRRIRIYFGGADLDNLAGRSLGAFLRLGRDDIDVDLVAGGMYDEAIRRQAADRPNIHMHGRLPTLAPLIEAASLGIGAGGSTSWERLCLGLPSIVIALADNQVPIAAELGRRGLACSLGFHRDADEALIASKIAEIVGEGLNGNWSQKCLSIVDGRGVQRICAVLGSAGVAALRNRLATATDEGLLLQWANDPETRRNALVPGKIDAVTHEQWFVRRLNNPEGCRIYIAETADAVPAGQIRFERVDAGWEVHYALAPDFRGLGLGRQMLEQALATFAGGVGDVLVIGRVKSDNRASLRIFESLGFDAALDGQLQVATMKRRVRARRAKPIHEGS